MTHSRNAEITTAQKVWRFSALAALALALPFASLTVDTAAAKEDRIEVGVLECAGEGGWGLILGSQKTMRCTLTGVSGKSLGYYQATISKFGLDIGVTGKTSMIWGVFAPASAAGDNLNVGSLEGEYIGVSADASAGVGLGAGALVGGGDTSFALQPVSVKAQTGVNLAIGVENFSLQFAGPAN